MAIGGFGGSLSVVPDGPAGPAGPVSPGSPCAPFGVAAWQATMATASAIVIRHVHYMSTELRAAAREVSAEAGK